MKNLVPKPEAGFEVGGIDPQIVEALGHIIQQFDLTEIEVEHGDLKVRVARQMSANHNIVAQAGAAHMPPLATAAVAPTPVAVPARPDAEHPGAVKSPMVGTVYLRPSPGAPAFVEIGSQVKTGDKILLIEAMKTFNEVVGPRAGTVTAILVEDGQPVEYGQPLIVIE
jgi:acetyl-CoA carboxylase biotin carboxyl carrier protein